MITVMVMRPFYPHDRLEIKSYWFGIAIKDLIQNKERNNKRQHGLLQCNSDKIPIVRPSTVCQSLFEIRQILIN